MLHVSGSSLATTPAVQFVLQEFLTGNRLFISFNELRMTFIVSLF